MSILIFLFLPFVLSMDSTDCGVSKDCLFSPPGCVLHQCIYFLSLSSHDEWTHFELATTNISKRTNYLALGFSEDESMGEEAVTFCYFPESGSPVVNMGVNEGKSNRAADDTLQTLVQHNIQMVRAEQKDSTLFCSFRQRIEPSTSHEMLPSLKKKFTLFLARGIASSRHQLGIHNLSPSSPAFPFISPSSINVTHIFPQSIGTSIPSTVPSTTPLPPSTSIFNLSTDSRLWMIRLHGVLMIIPWLSFIPTAILSARYLRNEWRSYSPGGLHIWFHIHRSLNWISLVLLIISTFLVLMAKDFVWKGPWPHKPPGKSTSPGAIHSLMGAISLVCTLLQFVSAFLRPSPHSKLRPYFNVLHRFVGGLSLVFALVATLLASNFFIKYWSDSWKSFLLTLLSTLLIIISFIALQMEGRLRRRNEEEEIEMSGGVSAIPAQPTKENLLRKIIFILFIILSLPLSIYISLLLILTER